MRFHTLQSGSPRVFSASSAVRGLTSARPCFRGSGKLSKGLNGKGLKEGNSGGIVEEQWRDSAGTVERSGNGGVQGPMTGNINFFHFIAVHMDCQSHLSLDLLKTNIEKKEIEKKNNQSTMIAQ